MGGSEFRRRFEDPARAILFLHNDGSRTVPSDGGLREGVTEENSRQYIDAYLAMGLKPEFSWMDAGWSPLFIQAAVLEHPAAAARTAADGGSLLDILEHCHPLLA